MLLSFVGCRSQQCSTASDAHLTSTFVITAVTTQPPITKRWSSRPKVTLARVTSSMSVACIPAPSRLPQSRNLASGKSLRYLLYTATAARGRAERSIQIGSGKEKEHAHAHDSGDVCACFLRWIHTLARAAAGMLTSMPVMHTGVQSQSCKGEALCDYCC